MNKFRVDFPQLNKPNANGKRLVYLDSGATTQKPQQVLNAVDSYYSSINANPHRGAYDASMQASMALEEARQTVANFIGADLKEEIVFCKNATEGLNLIAQSYGMEFLNKGDEILVCISEHHSNLLPWQRVARLKGCTLTFLYTNKQGMLEESEIANKINAKTKLVAISQVCNTTGVTYPIESITTKAHAVGAVVIVDGTQSAPHMQVNVKDLDADFFVFSGHKMLAPMGIGVVYAKYELLRNMPPFLLGGDMVEYVEEQTATFAPVPQRFESGTINVGGAIGLAAAIKYLNQIGMQQLMQHEQALTNYLLARLQSLDFVKIIGPTSGKERLGIVSFVVQGVHPHDVASVLNFHQVAIRAGNHCAQPFHKFLGLNSTCRVSIYLYNDESDIDAFIEALCHVKKVFL